MGLRIDFETGRPRREESSRHFHIAPIPHVASSGNATESNTLSDRTLRLVLWDTKPEGLLQRASVEHGQARLVHPALPAQRLMVGKAIPLAWLVARFAGCVARSEGRKRHVDATDDRRTPFYGAEHTAFRVAKHALGSRSSRSGVLANKPTKVVQQDALAIVVRKPRIPRFLGSGKAFREDSRGRCHGLVLQNLPCRGRQPVPVVLDSLFLLAVGDRTYGIRRVPPLVRSQGPFTVPAICGGGVRCLIIVSDRLDQVPRRVL